MANLNSKVIDKINKLLALGNNSAASPNERETALRQAYSLLAKHNLDMADLKEADERGKLAVLAKKHLWAVRLAGNIANLFFCEYVTGSGNANYSYHIFIGKEANAKVAIALFSYLVKSMMSEARSFVKKNQIDNSPYKAEMDFLKGASIAIGETAKRLREEKERENKEQQYSSQGTSLVLADYYKQEQEANNNWIDENMKVKTRNLKMKTSGSLATIRGYDYGSKVNLNTGLPDNSDKNVALS